jgi:Fis family transcriptional regulator
MASQKPLRAHVRKTVRRYLKDMDTTEPDNLLRMVLAQIEPPLIEEALKFTSGNQTRAARILGITRNTLRSKITLYAIEID